MCSEPAMRAPLSGWRGGVLLADRHEAGHLGLGDRDFLAAPGGELEVGDVVVVASASLQRSFVLSLEKEWAPLSGSTVPPSLTDRRAERPGSAAAPLGGRCGSVRYLASAFRARALSVRSQRELVLGAAEVAVRGGGLVDRPGEVEHLPQPVRRQVEVPAARAW